MVLNRNPDNYFAEVEQAAFAPSNFVPGVGASPDKLLQGRMFAYADAQRYRLGANHLQIPVNKSKHAAAMSNMRDGYMRVDGNGGKQPNYYPNTVPGTPAPNQTFAPPAVEIQAILDRHTWPTEEVDFIQPGELYRRVLNDMHKEHLVSNIVDHLGGVKQHIQYRHTA